jgi:hypothetical protein
LLRTTINPKEIIWVPIKGKYVECNNKNNNADSWVMLLKKVPADNVPGIGTVAHGQKADVA